MQTWKCSVKMPSNSIQNIEVNAYNYNDAVSIAESSTGGKCLNATSKWNNNSNSHEFNSSDFNGSGLIFVVVLFFIFYAWKWILLISAISFLIWIILRSIHE